MVETETIDQENEALIQEMMRDAQREELPTEVFKDPVVHHGDKDMPAPMILRELTSAGYVRLYDRQTGEEVRILYYMVPSKLRQKNPDGSYRFTAHKPKVNPRGGTLKCFLHADDPGRQHYNELGFHVCSKSNIPNEFARKEHMRKRHRQEWAAIEDEKKLAERSQDQELQREILKTLANQKRGAVDAPRRKPGPKKKAEITGG